MSQVIGHEVAAFAAGLAQDQDEFGIGLLGGDTTATPTSGGDDGLPGSDDGSGTSGVSADTDTDTEGASQDGDDGGCSCSTRSHTPASGALLLLGLVALRRRRR